MYEKSQNLHMTEIVLAYVRI